MDIKVWLERLAPDAAATFRRFPFAILLTALAAAILVAGTNDLITENETVWGLLCAGLGTGAAFSLAGTLFQESRPTLRVVGFALTYVVPLAVVAVFQVSDNSWFIPYLIPIVAFLWLSVSGFTEIGTGAARDANQNRFWWFNHRAVTTAIIAAAAFALILLGIFAIERSLAVLFGFANGEIFYKWVLPVIAAFFAPLYWFSTIPRFSDYDAKVLDEPDFLSRAIGFLGQFILAPLLLAYAAILLAYTVQILATRTLPQGMLGWMVMGFTMTGAATWLVLHPPFMRTRVLVRVFRRSWFWLTVLPLALFAVAVWTRIEAYGLTPERVGLVAGGIWAAAVTLAYLVRSGDIRLIPAIAAVVLLAISLGPWNIENAAFVSQSRRLDAALTAGKISGPQSRPQLNPAQSDAAVSATEFLLGGERGRIELARILGAHGITYDAQTGGLTEIETALGINAPGSDAPEQLNLNRNADTSPVDVSATPLLIGQLTVWDATESRMNGATFTLAGGVLVVSASGGELTRVPLEGWADRQSTGEMVDPFVDFVARGVAYRLTMDTAMILRDPMAAEHKRKVSYISGNLFSAKSR
jgi:hypothetical protein